MKVSSCWLSAVTGSLELPMHGMLMYLADVNGLVRRIVLRYISRFHVGRATAQKGVPQASISACASCPVLGAAANPALKGAGFAGIWTVMPDATINPNAIIIHHIDQK